MKEDLISRELVSALQRLRYIIAAPFVVSCGVRCAEYNGLTKGASPNSQHVKGLAVDFLIPEGFDAYDIGQIAEQEIEEFWNGGIGLYNSFIHLDIRGRGARWDRRTFGGEL